MGIVYGIATKIKNNGWLRGIIERNFARYCTTGRLFYHLEDFAFSQNFEDAILERLIREYHILSSGWGQASMLILAPIIQYVFPIHIVFGCRDGMVSMSTHYRT